MTPAFAVQLGWAIGQVLGQKGPAPILIGKDTRISGYLFETALVSGLVSAGVNAVLLGPMPTPAVAYLIKKYQAQAGIVISASHNPFQDNGFKLFNAEGKKLSASIEADIEALLQQEAVMVPAARLGKASRISKASLDYLQFCKETAPNLRLDRLKIVLDCAQGANYKLAPTLFTDLGATVFAYGVEPDGLNINANCGSTSPSMLREKVLSHSADLGIAFDGDGDRIILVDATGDVFDGDDILFLLATAQNAELVVGTLMSNVGLEHALKSQGIPFYRTNVGDKFVLEELYKQGGTLGGEPSGHIVCLEHSTTGDALIAALQVLQAMIKLNMPLSELKLGTRKLPQVMVNVRVKNISDALASDVFKQTLERCETQLASIGRIVVRPSGTEPVIRILVEGPQVQMLEQVAQSLRSVLEQTVAI